MTFLTPMLLVGLGALAVPVIIHLIQRERKHLVHFPSLMFLRRIPYPSVRRRRIRNWLLLAIRMTALALLVLAFARPFLYRPELIAASGGGPREVVILVDQSYSMGYATRWAEAQAAARRAIEGLAPGDRATLVLFSTSADVVARSSSDRAQLVAAIDQARVGASATRYGPALKLAVSALAGSRLPRREIVLVSDFQKAGWQRADAVRLPAGHALTPVRVGEGATANVAVTGVNLQRGSFSGQERVSLTAALVNRAPRAAELDVSLELDGRAIQTERVRMEPHAPGSATFAPFTLAGQTRGTVRLPPDVLPQDDVFHFVLAPGRSVPVLIVQRGEAKPDGGFFLTQALSIGSAPRFETLQRSLDQVGPTDLRSGFRGRSGSGAESQASGPAVVILNDVALPPGSFADALRAFVENGGGVLAVLGERGTWSDRAAGFLPGVPGALVDRATGRGAVLDVVDDNHPVFALFKGPLAAGFSTARFFRYRSLELSSVTERRDPSARPPADQPTVLARFDDRAIALVERRTGRGLAMTWTSTLDTFWNDLALKPVFLPFVHRTIAYLAGYREQPSWLTVGQVADAATWRGSLTQPSLLGRGLGEGQSGSAGASIDLIQTPSGQRLNRTEPLVELAEAGFYEIRFRGAAEPVLIASNVDTTESDLSVLDPKELVAAVGATSALTPALAGAAAGTAAEVPIEVQERQQTMWWYLLLVGSVLLAIETVVSNRLSRATN